MENNDCDYLTYYMSESDLTRYINKDGFCDALYIYIRPKDPVESVAIKQGLANLAMQDIYPVIQ